MTAFSAILFDFDGTLADSYAAITASVNYVRALAALDPLEEATVRGLVGHGLEQLMATVVPGQPPEATALQYREHHPRIMGALTHLLPGVAHVLPLLRERGIRLGVCSNKPVAFTQSLCVSLGITQYMEMFAGPETCGHAKPNPAMLLYAAGVLGATPLQTLYVGDMVVDIQCARAAGMKVYVVPTGSHSRETLLEAEPDRLMGSMAELVQYLPA